MNEREWLDCTDPRPMLRSLIQRWGAQKRKGEVVHYERLRLFACACLRRVWDLLDSDHRKAVEMIEEYARAPTGDGLRAARRVRWAAGNRASAEVSRVYRESPHDRRAQLKAHARNVASSAVWKAADRKPTTAANCHRVAALAIRNVRLVQKIPPGALSPGPDDYDVPLGDELAAQAALLRDVVGNFFRPAVLKPGWLTPSVGALAAAIDAERAFDRLPILADALEEAGCADAEVLDHCRFPGAHALGCWVADLLLKKI
jgi:hypothetical protein